MSSEEDVGQQTLETDISELLTEVKAFEFHDFKNSKYPTPKVELYRKLLMLAENIQDGKYDN